MARLYSCRLFKMLHKAWSVIPFSNMSVTHIIQTNSSANPLASFSTTEVQTERYCGTDNNVIYSGKYKTTGVSGTAITHPTNPSIKKINN